MRFLSLLALLAFQPLHAPADSAKHETPAGLAPGAALEQLKAGNEKFAGGKPSHRMADPARRKELSTGQKPHTIVLSCSDSRVPPELVFDQGLGELFTVRVAGNVLGAASVASMEYAVEHLGARLILILGHESCGAVKAALTLPKGETVGSYDLDSLLSSVQANLERKPQRALAAASEDTKLRAPVMANVDSVSSDLLKRSRIIREKVDAGKVRIVRGIYGLETGKVDFWDKDR